MATMNTSMTDRDSITSQNELLTMSYARGTANTSASSTLDESCTEEEKVQIAQLPKATFNSFVSPAERKRRQMAKLEAIKKQQEAENIKEPLIVDTTTNVNEDDSNGDSGSDDESSSSDTTSRTSNVNSNSPTSGGSNEERSLELEVIAEADNIEVHASNNDNNLAQASMPSGEDEDISEIPLESNLQKRKRAIIQEVMRDSTLSQVEKNSKIQDIIAGKVDLGIEKIVPTPQTPAEESIAAASENPASEVDTPVTDEDISEIPLESNLQKRKRAIIQEVMRDSSLSQVERNTKIQDIIAGKVDLGIVEDAPTPQPIAGESKAAASENVASEDDTPLTAVEKDVTKTLLESDMLKRKGAALHASIDQIDANKKVQDVLPGRVVATVYEEVDTPVPAKSNQPVDNIDESMTLNVKNQPPSAATTRSSDDLDTSYQRNIQRGMELKSQQQHRENQSLGHIRPDQKAAVISYDAQLQEKQKELELMAQRRKEMELQMEIQRKTLEMEQQRQMREIELQQQLELEMAQQRRLELEQQQREIEFQAEQRRLREESENRKKAERHRLEMERMQDLERQQAIRNMQQERERQLQAEFEHQRQADMSRVVESSGHPSNLSAVAVAKNLMSRMNYFRPPRNTQLKSSRYDGVDDDELNWRMDCYASLSDFTIVVHRALPGPFAPDFEVSDINLIDVALDVDRSPSVDVYHVHKVMLAVGGNRSELLSRRIRDAGIETESLPGAPSLRGDIHETILLEGAADSFGIVLDCCYFPDKSCDITADNAVPLVYLGKRFKIRALLTKAEAFVQDNLDTNNAVRFLLDAYLYHLDDVVNTAIDITASHFDDRMDFEPIYKLPIMLFRRIVASPCLKCDPELLSLVVYSYCGEHHRQEIDLEYFREVTRPKLMPDIDSKVSLMMLQFYIDLLMEDDIDRDIMQLLREDNLTSRCINAVAKNWRHEICEPLMIDAEWEETAASTMINLPPHEPAALHRSLPSQLQNRILERCLLVAIDDTEVAKPINEIPSVPESKSAAAEKQITTLPTIRGDDSEAIIDSLKNELDQAKKQLNAGEKDAEKELDELRQTVAKLETDAKKKSKLLDHYKRELKRFRRVPGIHNFGSISKKDPTIIDKTTCTYSANPDHHYPNHRRGNKPPTQMPQLAADFDNLGRQNGYVYNDGHGELLPVFYYVGDR